MRWQTTHSAACITGISYFAETAAEVYDTIRGLQKMRSGLDAAISGLERALEKFDA